MTKITQNFYQTKSNYSFWRMFSLLMLLLMGTQMSWGQQVIGSFPIMNGGFEGQATGNLTVVGSISTSQTTWTTQSSTSALSTLIGVGGRSGSQYASVSQTGTSARRSLQSSTVTSSPAGSYVIQFYYRGDLDGSIPASTDNIRGGIGSNGSTTSNYGAYVQSPNTGSLNWAKYTSVVTTSGTGLFLGYVGLSASPGLFDIDDYVIYAGNIIDITAPSVPGVASIPSAAATQQTISWGASSDVDGGGYMVVRGLADPTTTPNVNGIYAIGNTVATGETVAYIGTNNSFTDLGLTASTHYYYRIYTVDKAFNYSSAVSIDGSTTAPSYAAEPIAQVTGLGFSSISSNGFTINWTPAVSGGGTYHLVVVKAGSAISADPLDGSSFTANTAFGSGTALGGGSVVYNDNGNSVVVTGLSKAVTYYVKVYDFNGSAGSENYLIINPASANQMSLPGEIVSTGLNSAGVTWSTPSAWVGNVVPTANDNVTIAAGDKIQLTSSASCYNLTIASTGKLYNNNNVVGGTMNYLTIYGTTTTINGTLGDKDDTASFDCALGMYFNGNLTINGAGLLRPGRIRPNAGTQNATLTIDADMEMTYKGSTGTGGASIYTDSSGGNDNITITINSGKTLSFVPYSNFNTASSSGINGTASTTINVNGTVTLPTNCYLSLPIASGKTATLNVNGTLNIEKLNATSAISGAAPVITVGSGGLISVGNFADFSSATLSAAVTGSGTFTLEDTATMNIGSATGLEPVAGPIRTTTRNFGTGANYSYTGSGAQITGSDLPATVNNLTVNNTVGLSLGANTTLNNNLIIGTSGIFTVPSGKNLTIVNNITNAGTITVENNANLVQTSVADGNTGSGTAFVKRDSNPLFRLDYTMWSSPTGTTQKLNEFSPLTTSGRFYTYDSTPIVDHPEGSYVSIADDTPFSQGKGFLIRMPNSDPATLYNAGSASLVYPGVFTGVLNNGDITITNLTPYKYVAVGNPYPSSISVSQFLTANSNYTLYFWRKTNNLNQGSSPTTSYATTNLSGSVGNDGFTPTSTDIQVGQGFITTAPPEFANPLIGTIKFTNAMRTANNSAQFMRTKQVVKDRVWLNLSSGTNPVNQILVAYIDGATTGIDAGYDGKYINDAATALTSNIAGEEYVIQGRPAFDPSDVVALNFKTAAAGTFTIAKDHTEGVFATGQDVYLFDATTGIETNLQTDAYTFTADAGTSNARFSLKYQKTLKVIAPKFNEKSVTVYSKNGTLYVNSGANAIQNISVFDIQGRLVAQQNNVKANSASISNLKANQALIVKVTSEDNAVVSKKVVN